MALLMAGESIVVPSPLAPKARTSYVGKGSPAFAECGPGPACPVAKAELLANNAVPSPMPASPVPVNWRKFRREFLSIDIVSPNEIRRALDQPLYIIRLAPV